MNTTHHKAFLKRMLKTLSHPKRMLKTLPRHKLCSQTKKIPVSSGTPLSLTLSYTWIQNSPCHQNTTVQINCFQNRLSNLVLCTTARYQAKALLYVQNQKLQKETKGTKNSPETSFLSLQTSPPHKSFQSLVEKPGLVLEQPGLARVQDTRFPGSGGKKNL